MSRRVKLNLKHLKAISGIFVFALLIFYIIKNYKELQHYSVNFNFKYLLASFMLLLVAGLIVPITWYLITKSISCSLDFKKSLRVRLQSEIGKYIPGRIFGYGYLIVYYKDAGKDQVKVFNSSIYELYLATFSSFLFFTIIHFFTSFKLVDSYRLVFIILSVLGILSLHPGVFRKISDLICKIIKKDRLVFKVSYARILGILLLYLCYWLIFSLAFFLFTKAFIDIHLINITYISGTFAISTFAGFLAFFLPAGLGAREGVLVYLLGILTGNTTAIIIAISSRIWIILGDIVLFIGAFLSGYSYKKNNSN